MKIVAYLIAYNEENIIEENILYHAKQGIDTVVVDNGSTDRTLDIVEKLAKQGQILDYLHYPTKDYSWKELIEVGFNLARKHDPDWIIHLDANSFIESCWGLDVPLNEQIRKADVEECNLINLTVYDFYPTERDDPNERSIFKRIKFYTSRGSLSKIQQKIFKNFDGLSTNEGHTITFPKTVEKRISDKAAIMRHYVFLSGSHGVKKLLQRKNRWNDKERMDGFHIHYDGFLGFEEEVLVPSKNLIFKDEKEGWKDSVTYERPFPLPTERIDINKSHFFDKLLDEHSDICFIVGCQRSGTTLLRLILECHNQVSCYEEPTCYDYWADNALLEKELHEQKKLGKDVLVFKSPCLTEQFNNSDGVVKELRYHKFPFSFKYNNQLILFLVRDPRDVCLSLKKLKSNSSGQDWVDT